MRKCNGRKRSQFLPWITSRTLAKIARDAPRVEEADMHSLRNFSLRGKLNAVITITCSVAVLVACTVFAVCDVRTFQGFAASLGAPNISRASEELQELARSGTWIGNRAAFRGLETEIDRMYSELSILLRTVPS
jgi:hypothetical protein